ncbi:MAG TPA: gliding motility lipoprotein GldH [Bacteroidia bacterium]|nr:gliding motility lipoprotein GldH [Bacteroidia bacterium]
MIKSPIHGINLISKILILVLFLSSCSDKVVFSKYQSFENNEWRSGDKAVFEVDITDTRSLNNISLMIRHADEYPFRNIFLFVTTSYPDGKILKDTMEIVLANDKGEWHGSGMGDIFDLKVPVKKNVRFPLSGHYRFEFEQGMRSDPLPMVMDFGLEIEKSTPD